VGHVELGRVLAILGSSSAAREHFFEALRLAPRNVVALYGLGILSAKAGSSQEAIRYYQAALNSDPELKEAHFQLANELVRTDAFEDAASHFQTVVKLDPRNGFARLMLGIVLSRLQHDGEALKVLEESHRAFPDDKDISAALARLLAASPDNTLRDGPKALELITQVVRNQQNVDIEHVEILAMALAEIGSFDKAIEIQQKMISEAKRAGSVEFVAALEQTLELYREHKACRQPWRDNDPIFRPVPGNFDDLHSNLGPAGMRQGQDR
jgi:cytochrome c-type biogenesis protein CcmH/NrfG